MLVHWGKDFGDRSNKSTETGTSFHSFWVLLQRFTVWFYFQSDFTHRQISLLLVLCLAVIIITVLADWAWNTKLFVVVFCHRCIRLRFVSLDIIMHKYFPLSHHALSAHDEELWSCYCAPGMFLMNFTCCHRQPGKSSPCAVMIINTCCLCVTHYFIIFS